MAQVLDIFLVDQLTGEVIPMAEDPEKKKKKKWLGLLLPVGLFVIGFFEVIFTGGGGYRVKRIVIKYIDPRTGKQINS
jgi:uncharacterized membrane protein YfcA